MNKYFNEAINQPVTMVDFIGSDININWSETTTELYLSKDIDAKLTIWYKWCKTHHDLIELGNQPDSPRNQVIAMLLIGTLQILTRHLQFYNYVNIKLPLNILGYREVNFKDWLMNYKWVN